jgi:hypothetical protein
MKIFSALLTSRMKVTLTLLLFTPWAGLAQESLPYLVGTGTQLELVGFPVHSPALDAGTANTVGGTLVGWSPSFTDRPFGSALRAGQEYYAEVVGPAGHSWLGHRFELDETVTRTRTDHTLVAENSGLNTRGLPTVALVGAKLEVRPHLTLPGLVQDTIERRVMLGRERTESFQFFLPSPNGGSFWAIPFISSKGGTFWVDQKTLQTVPGSQLIVPPGSAVGMVFGNFRGLSMGLTGQAGNTPVAKPLVAGFNFASYPFSRNMRLGQDWGNQASGFRGATSPRGADRIEIPFENRRLIYSPEPSSGSSKLRWRLVNPARRHEWKQPAEYLDEIPVGQGFLIWKNQPEPNHLFYPPKP